MSNLEFNWITFGIVVFLLLQVFGIAGLISSTINRKRAERGEREWKRIADERMTERNTYRLRYEDTFAEKERVERAYDGLNYKFSALQKTAPVLIKRYDAQAKELKGKLESAEDKIKRLEAELAASRSSEI